MACCVLAGGGAPRFLETVDYAVDCIICQSILLRLDKIRYGGIPNNCASDNINT